MRPGLHFDLTRPRRRPSVRHVAHCIVGSIDSENTQDRAALTFKSAFAARTIVPYDIGNWFTFADIMRQRPRSGPRWRNKRTCDYE
jgi:hypothetical protein